MIGLALRASHSTGQNVIDTFSQPISCYRVGGFAHQLLCWDADSQGISMQLLWCPALSCWQHTDMVTPKQCISEPGHPHQGIP